MKRLLLVDDDKVILRSYRDRLSAHGFQVNTATDASTAIAILQSAKPDLVVLDLMMQPLSGVDVLKFIRGQPRLASTPVVVLTNAFLNDLGRQAAFIGIEKALLKAECSPSVLMGVIDELFRPEKALTDSSLQEAPLPEPIGIEPVEATAPSTDRSETSPPAPPIQSPQTTSTNRASETEGGSEGGLDLLAKALTICGELRKLLHTLSRATQPGPEQAKQLEELYRRVHFLTAVAGLTQYAEIAQVASVFEALLYVLMSKPTLLNPSVQRTLAHLVDFMEFLLQHAQQSRLDVSAPAKVLAVDDDPLSNQIVVRSLQEHGIEAISTQDPLEAWKWVQEQHYDVVLLDIEMPGLSGFDLCKRLRTLAGYKKTPVIFITSHSDFANRAKSTLSGGDDLLAKPVLPLELTAKVLMHSLKSRMTA